jgi:hypothetical protein
VGNAKLWPNAYVAKLSVNRVRETDNYCNAAPNRKQFETGYGTSLIITTEPERANYVEVTLDEVMGAENNTRIRVEGNGSWIEPQLDKCQSCNRWKISFAVEDLEEDTEYTLYSYEDENENELYDDGEPLELLEYRAGDLNILVASESSYEKHNAVLNRNVIRIAGESSFGYELYHKFINVGQYPASGQQNLVYRQAEVGTKDNTLRDDYLVNAWTHGAGVPMIWSASDGEKCDASVSYYTYGNGHPLHDTVMQSSKFQNALEKMESFDSFNRDKQGISSCNDGDCGQFVTSDLDIDLDYVGFGIAIPGSPEANLGSALGRCKLKYTAEVRLKDGIINDQYDIKIIGEVYDIYDFNYGKTLNTDGAIVQIGYDNQRVQGGVFISSVPFELTYSLDCFPLLGCSYGEELIFSELGDFSL